MLGGLPCMSSPILNTLAANHTTDAAVTQLMQQGRPDLPGRRRRAGGDATHHRKGIDGGVKLIATLNVELGAWPMMAVMV